VTDGDWLQAFAAIGGRIRQRVGPLVGTEAGRAELSIGAGGDRTVEVDRLAEAIALEGLEALAGRGERFSVLSEEVGLRRHGAELPLVLLDPIDGSLNAKQGLPVFSVMLALLDGPTVADVRVGYVLNLVAGESWHAVRGEGAFRAGARVQPLPPREAGRIELLGLESSPRAIYEARPLVERSSKLRILGSMALSVAHTAAGGIDVFCSPLQARVFDMTASVLMLAEVGGVATDMEGRPLAGKRVGLESRSTLLCSAHPRLHSRALAALRPA
jgi:myo-inositol-1(or 4)-monophosphatase